MKITRIIATPVNIPLIKPLWWTGGHYLGTSKVIIQVETDQGLVGLGEALDTDALKHWHDHYVDNGPLDHFHDPAMPGKFRRLPQN